jgi:hypothetical protein
MVRDPIKKVIKERIHIYIYIYICEQWGKDIGDKKMYKWWTDYNYRNPSHQCSTHTGEIAMTSKKVLKL